MQVQWTTDQATHLNALLSMAACRKASAAERDMALVELQTIVKDAGAKWSSLPKQMH